MRKVKKKKKTIGKIRRGKDSLTSLKLRTSVNWKNYIQREISSHGLGEGICNMYNWQSYST